MIDNIETLKLPSRILPSLEQLRGRAHSLVRAAEPIFDRLLANAWVSYLLIGALQIKVLWEIWKYRDLTSGDTSSYFFMAYWWSDNFKVDLLFSPLYTAFLGTIFDITRDVYATITAHRVIIVEAASLGVLALMRQLLPASLALLIATWWTVLPINFNVLYEVHLFALVTVLAAWLVMSARDAPSTRGAALAILLAATILVRNELVVGFFTFALICLLREGKQLHRAGKAEPFWNERLVGYSVPLLASAALCIVFYFRSIIRFPAIIPAFHHKHAFNMCQLYAFGYWQRHPEWGHNPWLDCPQLMERLFGNTEPTLLQMIKSNPAALLKHFLWNSSLILDGIQLALFNAVSGSGNPDFNPVSRSLAVLIPTLLVAAIVICGATKMARQWDYWWPNWIRERRGIWLVMLAVLCVALPVILTQRPRPSYLFPATVVMMALIGTFIHVLLADRWLVAAKIAAVVGVPLLFVAVPPYFSKHRSDRPLYTNYERLRPFAGLLSGKRNRIVMGDYESDLVNYLKLRNTGVVTMDYSFLSSEVARQNPPMALNAARINIFFIQPRVMPELKARPEWRQLLENPESVGWKKLAPLDGEKNWLLLYRQPQD
jgi:hypothetical protein